MPTLLIVDDVEGIHEMLDLVFEDSEYDLLHARNAQEGAAEYHGNDVDVILTDVDMPVKDGISLIADLKKEDPDLVPVIMTAKQDRKIVLRAIRVGVFDFVEKPFDEDDLKEVINRAYAERRKRRDGIVDPPVMTPEDAEKNNLPKTREDQLEAEVQRLREELAEKAEQEKATKRRMQEIEVREGAMKSMEAVIKERLQNLKNAEQNAPAGGMSAADSRSLEKAKRELAERENSIKEMEAAIQEREMFIQETEENLMEKGQRLQELEVELEQMREDLEHGGGGTLKGAGGEGLSAEDMQELQGEREKLAKREEELREWEERIKERERGVKKSEMLIKAREEFLAQSETILFGDES